MSDNRAPVIDWLAAGGAIATLATISPPAAAAAAVVLGVHHAYGWWENRDSSEEGFDKG
jgi:hypothetical protein